MKNSWGPVWPKDTKMSKNGTRQSRMKSIEGDDFTGLKELTTTLGVVDFYFWCSIKLCSTKILNWSVGETLRLFSFRICPEFSWLFLNIVNHPLWKAPFRYPCLRVVSIWVTHSASQSIMSTNSMPGTRGTCGTRSRASYGQMIRCVRLSCCVSIASHKTVPWPLTPSEPAPELWTDNSVYSIFLLCVHSQPHSYFLPTTMIVAPPLDRHRRAES